MLVKISTKPLIEIPYDIYNPICWIVVLTVTLLLLIITIYHLVITYKNGKLSIAKLKEQPTISLSFILLLMSLIFMGVCIHMNYAETFTIYLWECEIPKYTATLFYTSYKAMLYIILVKRLSNVFATTQFINYSKKWIIIWIISIITWTLLQNIINMLTTKVYLLDNHCRQEWSFFFLLSISLLDFSAAIVYGYLFTKPMIILKHLRFLNSSGYNKNDCDMIIKIAIKQCILCLVGCFSTIILSLLALIIGMTQIMAALDVLVSFLSVILMYIWNEKLFYKCCACCIWCKTDEICSNLCEYMVTANESVMQNMRQKQVVVKKQKNKTPVPGTIQEIEDI